MPGGSVTATWTGSYSRAPNTASPGPPAIAPLAVAVANTAGQWLFAVVSWRQDAGTAGTLQYPSTVTVSDDAGNFWIPVQSGQPQAGILRSAVWMAPAARTAQFVFASPTAYQSAITVLIAEVTAACPWYSVAESDFGYVNQGNAVSVTQGTTTTGLFSVGVVAYDNAAMPIGITSTGWTGFPSVTTNNGTDHSGDLGMYGYYATTAGSALNLTLFRSSGVNVTDAAGVLITVHGVTDALAFPYALPLENWPVLITEIASGPVLNSNPLMASTADWTGVSASVAAVTWPLYNPWPAYQTALYGSVSLTPSGSAASSYMQSGQYAVSSAVQYQALAWVYSAAGYNSCSVTIRWYTSGASFISATAGIAVTVLAGTWTQLSLADPVFPPSTAAFGQVTVTETAPTGNVPSSAVLYAGYAALTVADAYEGQPPDEITWTDVSSRNYNHQAIQVARGIQYEQQSLEAGTMAVSLANFDAAWTFGNVASPYWPNAGDTDVPVRMRAVWPGSLTPYYPVFSGYTDAIAFGWEDDRWYAYARITASDCWSRLTQQLLSCAIQEAIQDGPQDLFTCSLIGANSAPGGAGSTPVMTTPSMLGTHGATATFTSTAISLAGAPGQSCWQSTGTSVGDLAFTGVALAYFPVGGSLPPVASGLTVEFWMSPQSVSASQPPQDLTVCTCWARKGPMWTIWIDNTAGAGFSSAYVTVYDRGTGAGTTTALGSSTYLGTAAAAGSAFFSVSFTTTTLTVAVNPGGPIGATRTTVSCNLNTVANGFSWGGNAGPVYGANPDTTLGFMNLAVAGIGIYPSRVPAARQAAHFTAAYSAFVGEIDTWRLARIAGYSGFIPPLAMRCLDLPVPPAADLDIVTGATDTSGQVVSAYFTNIAASTLAVMLVNGAGSLVYRRRLEWYDRASPQWALGEGGSAAALTGVPLNNTLSSSASTSGWAAQNGAALTSSGIAGVNPLFYPFAGLFHGDGSTASPQIAYNVGPAGNPVVPGEWFTLSAWLYSPQGWASGVVVTLEYWTVGISLISQSATAAIPLPAGSLVFFSVPAFRAPAAAAIATAVITAQGTPASSVQFYAADVILSQVPPAPAGGSAATAPEAPYLPDATLDSDRALLFNVASLTQYGTSIVSTFTGTGVTFGPSSGVVVQIQNAASVAARGAIPYTATIYLDNTAQATPYYLNDPSMEDFGYWVTQTLGSPLFRPGAVTLTPAATPQALLTGLGMEVGDTATVRRRQIGVPDTQILAYGSKLTHEIMLAADPPVWNNRHELSPYPAGTALACDDVVHGCLTGGGLLGW